jgi:hypothetical protein
VTIDIRTDVPCSLVQKTSITVGSPADAETAQDPTAVTASCAAGFIGSLVTVPATDSSAKLAVRVVTGVDRDATQCSAENAFKGCVVARRRLAYVPHTPLFVPVFMNLNCKDVPCDVRSTCNRLGQCVSAELDPGRCAEPSGCTVEGDVRPPDAGLGPPPPPGDGGGDARDGAGDAPTDAIREGSVDGGGDDSSTVPRPGVRCLGSADCISPQYCCFDANAQTGTCQAQQTPCPFGGGWHLLRCDGREDCPNGLCCLSNAASICVASGGECTGLLMCNTQAQCASGTCAPAGFSSAYRTCQ